MSRRGAQRAALAACMLGAACIGSNVVAPTERMAPAFDAEPSWSPASAADLVGFHESVDLQGDAAVALRKVFYLFAADGSYTGAALADDGERLAFQTLTGAWSIGSEGLVLDGQPAATCEAAAGELRITAPNGVLRLRRKPVE